MTKTNALKNATKILTEAVAVASYGLSIGKMDRPLARSYEEASVKKAIRRFGIFVVLQSVLFYRRAIHNTAKDGKITIVRGAGDKRTKHVVPMYTYGIDEFIRKRWPEQWREALKAEKESRRGD